MAPESKTAWLDKGSRGVFWLCALLVYGYRLYYVFCVPFLYYHEDSGRYLSTALRWAQQGLFSIDYFSTPAYPVFLLGINSVASMEMLPVIQHISLITCIVFLGYLVSVLFSGPQARIAAGLFVLAAGFMPSQFIGPSSILTEGIQTQLLILIICCFHLWLEKPSMPRSVLLAVPLAFAALLRPVNMILFMPALLVMILYLGRKSLVPLAVLVLTSFLLFLPWMIQNQKQYQRFALYNISSASLVLTFGHLIEMQSPQYAQYKRAITPDFLAYMEKRNKMSPTEKLFAGGDLIWGDKTNIRVRITQTFHLKNAQRDKILKGLVKEGILAHPLDAARHVVSKWAFFYLYAPWRCENLYRDYSSDVPLIDIPQIGKTQETDPSQPWTSIMDPARQNQSYQKAKIATFLIQKLIPFFSFISTCLLWACFLLAPALLLGSRAWLGLFVTLLILVLSATTCIMAPPLPRYYQPLTLPVLFLLCLEILSLWSRFFRGNTQRKNGGTSQKTPLDRENTGP